MAKLYLLSDKGGCDMTMAQFSKDDILIYQGREEGIWAFVLDKVEDGVEENIKVKNFRNVFLWTKKQQECIVKCIEMLNSKNIKIETN